MEIKNAIIESASLSMADHGCITFNIGLNGGGWGCSFGGYCLGHGYLGAEHFDESPYALEAIMRIMDTVGVERLEDLRGKVVRTKSEGWGSKIDAIGNVLEDKWFSWDEFFMKKHDGR